MVDPQHPTLTERPRLILLAALLLAAAAGHAQPADLAAHLPTMITVSAGAYVRGSSPSEVGHRPEEHPAHRVVISRAFELAAVEVTQGLWRAVMTEPTPYFANLGDRGPAESLTWFDAIEFCNALSIRLGLQPAYARDGDTVTWRRDADGYRLPTEAEWEYACRAGAATAFATGRCLDDGQANFDSTKQLPGCPRGMFRREPLPVGSFPPNAWGFHDMHGNVHEWCWDTPSAYADPEVVDPVGPDAGDRRSLRGGGWISAAGGCRSAMRYFIEPDKKFDFVGLRLARSLSAHATEEATR